MTAAAADLTATSAPATVERLEEALHLGSGEPVLVLYGSGTEDSFICTDYQQRSLKEALLLLLKNAGYRRVVFSSSTEPLHFLDAESLGVQRPGARGRSRAIVGPQGRRVQFGGGAGQQADLAPGQGGEAPAAAGRTGGTITDAAAVQTLNAYMRRTDVRTAVVVELAEDFLARNEAGREFAGRLGEWVQGAAGTNLCVLVFSASSQSQIVEAIRRYGSSAALADYVERRSGRSGSKIAGEIRTPERPELHRLVQLARLRHGLVIPHWDQVDRLVNMMTAQGDVLAGAWLKRLSQVREFTEAEIGHWLIGKRDDRSALERLDALTGLHSVKEHVRGLIALSPVDEQLRQKGVKVPPPSRHLVFRGNPGTGKTTVAETIGQLYRELGVLKRGHLVNPEASELVADVIGGTAIKTNAVIDSAIDGVLLIDEAYRLTAKGRGGFGQEAVDTLLSRLENERERLVVIVAGYSQEMDRFLASNPGLRRRFSRGNELDFADYTPEELHVILLGILATIGHTPDPALSDHLLRLVTHLYDNRDAKTFGNAGEMRNLAEATHQRWAVRISETAERTHSRPDITAPLTADDVPTSYREPSV
ncbi:AAA family ATPase [Streptomyces sp. NPDC002659]|uniref:AAA family ATPase n=1 Tax=Streptomyces sp. NPDC002659 TaxID=3364656 RepID=UPI00369B4A51